MEGCPRDGSKLFEHKGEKFDVWRCGKCEGLWIPEENIREIIGEKKGTARKEGGLEKAVIQCPEDRAFLAPIHFHGIEIDLCTKCGGVWLDKGELERILKKKGYTLSDFALDTLVNAPDAVAYGAVHGADAALDALGVVLEFLAGALS